MSIEYKLPQLGEGVESAEVSRIYVQPGDTIEAEQSVMELESDKAVADLPCPHAGKIAQILVSEGDTVQVGQTLLTIESPGENAAEGEAAAGEQEPAGESQGPAGESEEPAGESEQSAGEAARGEAEPAQEQQRDRQQAAPAKAESQEQADEMEPPGDASSQRASREEQGGRQQGDEEQGDEEQGKQEGRKKQQGEQQQGEQQQGERQAAEKPARRQASEQDEGGRPGTTPGARRTLLQPEHGRRETSGARPAEEIPPASPATRRLARKLGVDLQSLARGDSGRITLEDVVRAFAAQQAGPAAAGPAVPPLPDFSQFGPIDREPLNKLGRTAAERLAASWPLVPQVTQHGLADITELETARQQYQASSGQHGPKITLTALAIASTVVALKEFPRFNSSLDWPAKELVLKHYYHIGVAVDTEHGLMVPVIANADRKNIAELAGELTEVAERARTRKLQREEMQGGTFTLSNQGGIGGTAFTPLVNYPEVAILGLSRATTQLELIDGQPQPRLKLPLSLSYDHRVINGADAARFVTRLEQLLSDAFGLLVQV